MDLTGTIEAPLREEEAAWLRELLAQLGTIAREARFQVAPNPCVGAAVVSNGVEVGRGIHELWGSNHAEPNALAAAEASGIPPEEWDTLVITLEPCSTVGKTPSCVERIKTTSIKRVVVGALDPDPRHRGRGLQLLHEAGLEVVHLRGGSPLEVVAPHFVRWTQPERIRRRRPWTIAKWAQTRTGQLRPPEDVGEGRWISGAESRAQVHELRGRVDAIVTGIGTVVADDPRLTVRAPGDLSRPPLRVVLDTELRLRPDARLFAAASEGEAAGAIHVFARPGADGARHRALEAAGATVHLVRLGDDGRPSLREVAAAMWDLGVRRAMIEAGPGLLTSYFEAEMVDQIQVYTGPVNGGRGQSMGERLTSAKLRQVMHREVGDDSVLEAFLER